MPQIIDLRKKNKKGPVIKPAVSKKPKEIVSVSNPAQSPLLRTLPPKISWEAPSFYFNPQKRYLALLIVALVLGGGSMLFLRKDTLTAIFLILSSFVLILYSNKRPEISKVTISQSGIAVGETMYYYKDLKSFWIHYEPGNTKELSLESRKWYMPYVKVSIENKNPLEIRSLLVNFVAEKEHEHSLVDIISRKIGL